MQAAEPVAPFSKRDPSATPDDANGRPGDQAMEVAVRGRKVRNEAEAVALIEEARLRGVEPREVAVERGICGRSLQGWRLVFSKRRARPSEEAILELVPMTVDQSPTRSYRVWVGELVVEVGDEFDEGTLRRLVSVLRAC